MSDSSRSLIRPDLKNYCPASNLAFNEKIKALQAEGHEVYHFGFGQAPFPVLPEMVEALKGHAAENAYLPVAGIPELRQAVLKFHSHYDNLHDISIEQVLIGPGTKELIFLLLCVFNGEVILVSPSWTTYKPQTSLAGKKCHVVSTSLAEEWRLAPQTLENYILENGLAKTNLILVLCNPDNPTGTSYGTAHLQALSQVLRRYRMIVVSDEIYGRLHYEQKHTSLASVYPEGTILSSGMSKWSSAGGWRIGYHVYPTALKELCLAVKSAASHTYSCASAPVQYAVAKVLGNIAVCDPYIRHTTRILQAVGDHVHSKLSGIGVRVHRSQAGYYCFPDFEFLRGFLNHRNIHTCEQMCAAMFSEASVALMAGGPAFLRPADELTVRLCYVNFDGGAALAESQRIGLNKPLPASFVQEHCTPVHRGIEAIMDWCEKQKVDALPTIMN